MILEKCPFCGAEALFQGNKCPNCGKESGKDQRDQIDAHGSQRQEVRHGTMSSGSKQNVRAPHTSKSGSWQLVCGVLLLIVGLAYVIGGFKKAANNEPVSPFASRALYDIRKDMEKGRAVFSPISVICFAGGALLTYRGVRRRLNKSN